MSDFVYVNKENMDRRREFVSQLEEDIKELRKSPFSRWTQFNNEHTKELIQLALNHPKAHAILYFLVDQMDNYNACICSYKTIQEVLGCSQPTVARNIKILKDSGFLVILKSGNANIYTINDKVYWKSWGSNKKYSKFPANVVLALSEQDEDYRKKIHGERLKAISVKDLPGKGGQSND